MKETLIDRAEREAAPEAKPAPAERKLVHGGSHLLRDNLGAWAAYLQNERADTETTTETVVWNAVEALVGVSEADGCSVSLTDWGVEMVSERVNGDLERRTALRDTMAGRGTIGHEAIRTGAPQSVYKVREDGFHHYPANVRNKGYQSIVCFPLGHRGRSLGVLTFYYKTARRIEKKDRDVAVILAQSVALAIDNSLLITEGRQNCFVTVQALIRSLEAKDSETSFHSLRVTQHVTVLGEQMGLPQREIEVLQYGASLHDLGKIGILGKVLNKQGKLTDDEFSVVRKHPVIGARIVETVDYLADAVPIIRHHHECFDGSGYPDGLAGSDIPLGARIVAIPDFYDALTSDRPYRPAYSHDKAIEMVRERIGIIFDPKIAHLFLAVQDSGNV